MVELGPDGSGQVRSALRRQGDARRAAASSQFFKTGDGEYGEGDRFLGVRVPDQRRIARRFRDLPLSDIEELLNDEFHECRLTALFILVSQYERADRDRRRTLVDLYLANLHCVNNWDLVDSSAGKILGAWLEDRDQALLVRLARSPDLWKQRVAMIATSRFIGRDDFGSTLKIARILLNHEHDLIHKAVGWMLREVGKRDKKVLDKFLRAHYRSMPRTMLRYAIEKFPDTERRAYLKGQVAPFDGSA